MRPSARLAFLMLAALLLSASRRRAVMPPKPLLDMRRSFAVTDKAILDAFPLERTMNAIAAGTSTTGLQLFQQMFDTQNAKPGLTSPGVPHCDDFLTNGAPSFNGFLRRCPTPEGMLAGVNPFVPAMFMPTAVVNRFDQTPADGSNCGQYRIVYSRAQLDPAERTNLIFEAVLPNPNPSAGIAACRDVAQFWADLSNVDSLAERRARLETFFYQGIPGFAPVVQAEHYDGAGGIRASESMQSVSTRMYQFRARKQCSGGTCGVTMVPDVLENMAYGKYFDASVDTPQARRFREELIAQVPSLAVRDVNLYSMHLSNEFLMAESNPSDTDRLFIFDVNFENGLATPAGQELSDRIAAELQKIGSTLTPQEIVTRAETQMCMGCHFGFGPVGEGVVFPRSNGAEHVNPFLLEDGDGGPQSRFAISPAMHDVFIPHRMTILLDFLRSGKAPVHSN